MTRPTDHFPQPQTDQLYFSTLHILIPPGHMGSYVARYISETLDEILDQELVGPTYAINWYSKETSW